MPFGASLLKLSICHEAEKHLGSQILAEARQTIRDLQTKPLGTWNLYLMEWHTRSAIVLITSRIGSASQMILKPQENE